MTIQPPITVITVCYNAAATIAQTIESVIAQNIEGLEYIVIDGASKDNTLEIIKRYDAVISKIISEPDTGMYDAMNKGLRAAHGKFIHFLNADDCYLMPGVLKKLLPQLEEDKVCYAQLIYRERDGRTREVCKPYSWEREIRVSCIPQPTLFVSKKLYNKIGEYDANFRIAGDYDMILRLVKHRPVKFITDPVTLMNAGGVSDTQMGLAFKEAAFISHRHGRSAMGCKLTYWNRMMKWKLSCNLPPAVVTRIRQLRGSL